jgi:ubiquinone/menaquinone biosynthesis C-methylase UbiE
LEDKLSKIYRERFSKDMEKRELTWRILVSNFFNKYIKDTDSVLEVASGYGHFINNIVAKEKYAIDQNPDSVNYLKPGVVYFNCSSTKLNENWNSKFDIIFVSNFFEHITKGDILLTLNECHRVLKKNGKIIVLQPNIRFLEKDYWMFFDHITPLDDRSLSEALVLSGFQVSECFPKFLPFTLQGRLPVFSILIIIY